MEIQAFPFNSFEEAKTENDIINAALGYPKSGGETLTYADIQQHPTDGFYYIQADEVTELYLGQPQTITLPDPVRTDN